MLIRNRIASVDLDSDETAIDLNEWKKLAQKKYKSSYDWVGKMIQCELCHRLKLGHTTKRFIRKTRICSKKKDAFNYLGFTLHTDYIINGRRLSII